MRFETGDEMSRRAKFAFITWIGPSVGVLKKARVSTDKAFVKAVWPVSVALRLLRLGFPARAHRSHSVCTL